MYTESTQPLTFNLSRTNFVFGEEAGMEPLMEIAHFCDGEHVGLVKGWRETSAEDDGQSCLGVADGWQESTTVPTL